MKTFSTFQGRMKELITPLRTLNSLPVILFCSILINGVLYRVRLFTRFVSEQEVLIDDLVVFQIFSHLDGEFYFALMILAPTLLIWFIFFRIKVCYRFFVVAAVICFHILFALLSLAYITHFHLIFNMHSGLTRDIIGSVLTESFLNIRAFSLIDFIFLLLMPILFWFFKFRYEKFIYIRNVSVIALSMLIIVLSLMKENQPKDLGGSEMESNPIIYAVKDIMRPLRIKKIGKVKKASRRQMQSLAFIDDAYATGPVQAPLTRWGGKRKWNLLYIIMESTGAEYVFNTKLGNRFPMPFLKKLSEKSLYMTNHYSPSNTSPRSLFSLFTGLYPAPRERMFVTRKDVKIPSILKFLGKDYQAFLVTPGSLEWFFPRGFYINNGVDLYGYYTLPPVKWGPSYRNSRNESQTVDFFIKRLKKTHEPFVSIYYSYVAHWPYFYYGLEYDVFHPKKLKFFKIERLNTLLTNYYSNLRLMDVLIKRIFNYLEKSGRLDRTIIIITGDHGEAFGQHIRNWIHSRGSFNENYRVPMIIYQPRLFEPRKIHERTLHIDIMPTLLDAMGIQYNPALIQGESLYQRNFRRNYVFLYGNERAISSISKKNIKVMYSLMNRQCRAYDLNVDPGEHRRISCRKFVKQKRILLQYLKQQNRILTSYNNSIKKGEAFFGERHPDLPEPGGGTKVKLNNQKKQKKRKQKSVN